VFSLLCYGVIKMCVCNHIIAARRETFGLQPPAEDICQNANYSSVGYYLTSWASADMSFQGRDAAGAENESSWVSNGDWGSVVSSPSRKRSILEHFKFHNTRLLEIT